MLVPPPYRTQASNVLKDTLQATSQRQPSEHVTSQPGVYGSTCPFPERLLHGHYAQDSTLGFAILESNIPLALSMEGMHHAVRQYLHCRNQKTPLGFLSMPGKGMLHYPGQEEHCKRQVLSHYQLV